MRIFTQSKLQFNKTLAQANITNENISGKKDMIFISINNSKNDKSILKNNSNVLVLYFDDIIALNSNSTYFFKDCKLFSNKQAKMVVNFVDKYKNIADGCLIHCSAGVSRSGAIATFINEYLNRDNEQFLLDNPHIYPNQFVLNLLKKQINN